MWKRLLIYLALCIAVSASVVIVYNNYKPTDISDKGNKINYNFDKVYSLDEYSEYISHAESNVIVIFFDEKTINSQYFFNTTLPAIISARNLTSLNNLIYVNVTDAPDTLTKAVSKTKYGYSSVPCLANIKYSEGAITVVSSLEEDGNSEFTTEKITSWLISNKVIPE